MDAYPSIPTCSQPAEKLATAQGTAPVPLTININEYVTDCINKYLIFVVCYVGGVLCQLRMFVDNNISPT